MLLRAPDLLDDPAPNAFHLASFADLAAYRALEGADAVLTGSVLALPPAIANQAANPSWTTTFGYTLAQVDQTLLAGEPLDAITLLRGRFAEETLRDAWVRAGYQAVELDGATVWSIAPDGSLDVSSPVGRLAQATHNNAMLLPDGTLVFATRLASLRAVIAVDRGREAALGARPSTSALLGQVPPGSFSALLFATAWLVTGDVQSPPDILDQLSPVRLALVSISASPTPLRLALLFDDAASALPAPRLLTNRLEPGSTAAASLSASGWALNIITRAPGEPVVVMEFERLANAPPAASPLGLTRQEVRLLLG